MKMTSAINPAIMKNMEYSLVKVSAMFNNQEEKFNNQEEKVCAFWFTASYFKDFVSHTKQRIVQKAPLILLLQCCQQVLHHSYDACNTHCDLCESE